MKEFYNSYSKLKVSFYKNLFVKENEYDLKYNDIILLEIINLLNSPTITELVNFMETSQPNVTYRVSVLEEKEFIKKEQSRSDKREYKIVLTQKFYDYQNQKDEYINNIFEYIKDKIEYDDYKTFLDILNIFSNELISKVKDT